jgi:hypothetical protein
MKSKSLAGAPAWKPKVLSMKNARKKKIVGA